MRIDGGDRDSEQLGGWGRTDEWDPLVSGPERWDGLWAVAGLRLLRARERREKEAGLRPSCYFFDRSNFLVLFQLLRAILQPFGVSKIFEELGKIVSGLPNILEGPHVFVLKI